MTRLLAASLLLGPLWFGSLWLDAAAPFLPRLGPVASPPQAPVAPQWDAPLGTPGPQPTVVVRVEVVDADELTRRLTKAGLAPEVAP